MASLINLKNVLSDAVDKGQFLCAIDIYFFFTMTFNGDTVKTCAVRKIDYCLHQLTFCPFAYSWLTAASTINPTHETFLS